MVRPTMGVGTAFAIAWVMLWAGSGAHASSLRDAPSGGAPLVSLGASERYLQQLGPGDIQPQIQGVSGAVLEVAYCLTPEWALTASGHMGGSWLDFAGFGVGGSIQRLDFDAGLGVRRMMKVSHRCYLYAGARVEYGETRSWLKSLTFNDQGPHNYRVGGAVDLGIARVLGSGFQIFAEASPSAYLARARDWPLGTDYRWLGNSFETVVGTKWVLWGRRIQETRSDPDGHK